MIALFYDDLQYLIQLHFVKILLFSSSIEKLSSSTLKYKMKLKIFEKNYLVVAVV